MAKRRKVIRKTGSKKLKNGTDENENGKSYNSDAAHRQHVNFKIPNNIEVPDSSNGKEDTFDSCDSDASTVDLNGRTRQVSSEFDSDVSTVDLNASTRQFSSEFDSDASTVDIYNRDAVRSEEERNTRDVKTSHIKISSAIEKSQPPHTPSSNSPKYHNPSRLIEKQLNKATNHLSKSRPENQNVTKSSTSNLNRYLNTLAKHGTTLSIKHSRMLNSQVSIISLGAKPLMSKSSTTPEKNVFTIDLTKEHSTPEKKQKQRSMDFGECRKSALSLLEASKPHPCGSNNTIKPNQERAQSRLGLRRLQYNGKKHQAPEDPLPDLAIPVINLREPTAFSKLVALGIRFAIPLTQLHSSSGNGMFGLPVVAIDSASNPAICNVGQIGASNLLPLGQLKNLALHRV